MAKLIKIIRKGTRHIAEWLLFLIICLAFAVRTSSFQTFLGHQLTAFFSSEWNTKVHIGKVDIVFFDKAYLDEVFVQDLHQDTLVYLHTFKVKLNAFNLEKKAFHFESIGLNDGTVKIKEYKNDTALNIQFIIDYFKSDDTKPKKFELTADNIQLNNIHFVYDKASEPKKARGMDYAHLDIENIFFSAQGVRFKNGVITAQINHIKAREKAGFVLKDFAAVAKVSEKGIFLKKAVIQTPKSSIFLPKFDLITGKYTNYKSFVDSVAFNARLGQSSVFMGDVAQFAPQLWGMNQMVEITAKVTEKVKNLKIENLKIKTGNSTELKGDFQLPDFRKMDEAVFDEKIASFTTSTHDISNFRLSNAKNVAQYVQLPQKLENLGKISLKNLQFKGKQSDFTVYCQQLQSDIAKIHFPGGIHLIYNSSNEVYQFNTGDSVQRAIQIEYFDLGQLLNNDYFGNVSGNILLAGKTSENTPLRLSKVVGQFSSFVMNDYTYSNIKIDDASYGAKVFKGKISVKDKNLNLDYQGTIDFNKIQKINAVATIHNANLSQLNFTAMDSTSIACVLKTELYGEHYDKYSGVIQLDTFQLQKGEKKFAINTMKLNALRHEDIDTIRLRSDVLDAKIVGEINFQTFVQNFSNQIKQVFPALFEGASKTKFIQGEEFAYTIQLKNVQPILDVLAPEFSIAKNSSIEGGYSGFANVLNMDILSDHFRYNAINAYNINLHQDFIQKSIEVNYKIGQINLNDSLQFSDVWLLSTGEKNKLTSVLKWGGVNDKNPGKINCKTIIRGEDTYFFSVTDSYFKMRNKIWKLSDSATITYAPQSIAVNHLKFEHDNQILALNGKVSIRSSDKLQFLIQNFDLADVSTLFGPTIKLSGMINGLGTIATPFTKPSFEGNVGVFGLFINQNEVGDINFDAQYLTEKKQFDMNGQLFYKGNQSIFFEGNYSLIRQENSLDLYAIFDNTNINFVNSFLNPEVVSNIHGIVSGKLAIQGTLKKPIVEGKVHLIDAGAKLEMFGTSFGVSGEIVADQYGFYLNNIPIYDQEGNAGSVIGTVFHENFKNWNFDLSFNLEDDALRKNPLKPWLSMPLKQFLVMNTMYEEGDFYYGKAYVTGTANVFGYADNLEVTVNATTQEGTTINFPMYGQAAIDEESNFIQFISEDSIKKQIEEKIDLASVALDLNFDVTEDARVKIIFDANTGDEIAANGNGTIRIGIDQQEHVTLEGTYRVKSGKYNFAMGPIKKNFYIQEGGTVQWTGNPYDAALNLKAYYLVSANLTDVMPTIITDDNTNFKDLIYCYVNLGGSLSQPAISFDIAAPRTSDSRKSILNRVRSTKEELNRQFFSLILFRKFQPLTGLKGANVGAGNAALEVVSNQINSVLDKVSEDYKLSVKLNNDAINNQNSYEFGVSKGFLNDRLILSGNFGVNQINANNKQTAANSFIGDVNLEYKLNKSGTFRVNIFNESNQYSIISKKNLGLFTQGIGLHYQESFNNINDFKLVQYVLDLFRKAENKRYIGKKKNNRTPIPKKYFNENKAIKNEENSDSQ